jgi:ADP-heptose:LPS heptosyltransferase
MFNIIQTELGIGDVICSLYAIQGLAIKFPEREIHFYIPQHFDWADIADIPKMKVRKYQEGNGIENPIYLYNGKADTTRRVKHTNSPKKLFASKLDVEPETPPLKSEMLIAPPIFKENYIVLSPFASRLNRTWELHNWRIVARELGKAGYKVIVLDSPFEGARCKEIGVEYYWGQKMAWTINVCNNAAMIISNDSGLAHFGGWLGVKTLVLMSQLLPEQFYDMTDNRFIVPKQGCTSCRFLPENGYEEKCDFGCWVLQSIRPSEVVGTALEWLKEKRSGGINFQNDG